MSSKFEQIVKMANEGIWTIGPDGLTDFINERGAAMLGYTPKEMLGRPFIDFVLPEDKKMLEREPDMIQQGKSGRFEVRMPRKDGSEVWLLITTSPMIGDDGRFHGAVSMATDITERKRWEKALKESKEDLNLAQKVAKTGSWRLKLPSEELVWSDENYSIFGVLPDTPMTYDKFLDIVHPDDRDYIDERWQAAMRGEPYDVEHRIVVNSEVRWVRERGILEFKDNALTSGFGTTQDITERRKMEGEILRSRHMLRLVLESVPVPVFWKDLDSRYLGCNRLAARDAGLSDPLEIIGKTDFELAWRGSASYYRADDIEVMRTGIPKMNYEEPQVQADGRTLWLRTNKLPLREPDGKIIGVLATYEDITERKQAEQDLRRSNAELQQFAYVASHDLQEPLRMVTVYLELLNKKYGNELNPQAKEYMSTVIESSERMRQLINDLLQYSRIDARQKELTNADLTVIAENVKEDLHVAINEAKAHVIIEPLPTIMADEAQIAQVLQNLLKNAIKFRGKEPPKIVLFAHEGYDEWIIGIQDNGIGIDPKYQDKLFNMFQRLHTQDEYPGTGIGLAIAKKIVERNGGRIWVESDGKNGSTFYFTIPKT